MEVEEPSDFRSGRCWCMFAFVEANLKVQIFIETKIK